MPAKPSNTKRCPDQTDPLVRGIGGAVGGISEACLLQPMDVIKTRLQLDKTGVYRGSLVTCGRTVAQQEGLRALWKGLTPFATHLGLKYMLRMSSNTTYQNLFRDKKGQLSTAGKVASGFLTGVTEATVVVTPFEVVKIKLQQQKIVPGQAPKYLGPLHTARTVLLEEGVLGLWAGWLPTVLRNGTNQMCLFSMKHFLDELFWDKRDGDGKRLEFWQAGLSAMCAATVGPVATGPFDVAKTRLMAQESVGGAKKYRNLLDVLITVPREEGLAALWKGLGPRLLRIPPGQAITWAVADRVIWMIENNQDSFFQ
mmetsp:Transcript_7115/g.26172  ORF Transcript_7115/g.26172 Transcript_7115/m.26172 type:complete len:312 (-) Transcript_7115:1569-2504(-)